MNHKERAHAVLSASKAHRWLLCTPSARLEEQFPDTTSNAAREGTLAHELAEMKLRHFFQTKDFGKRKYNAAVKKIRTEDLWQGEMEEYTEIYKDYIKTLAISFPTEPYVAIEKKVDFSSYVPEGFGTADCILLSGDTLHVVDLKYGKGVPVDAEENPQMMLYALGAYHTYSFLYDIKKIHLVIVQPRLDSISEWTCPLGELLGFAEYAKERAVLAIKGEGAFCPGEKQCRFCRAKAQCRARAEENVKLAFSSEKGKLPPLISNEEMGTYLSLGEDVAKWLADLKECALGECLAGHEVPGWKAVEGRGSRDWTDMEEAFTVLKEKGIPEEILYERKALTLAQVEKTIGKKDFAEMVGSMVIKNPGKPTLVKESNKREAITNKITAEKAFQEGQ